MDFFTAEERAKRRTSRLLVLFGFAVAATILASYVAAVVALRWSDTHRMHYWEAAPAAQLWYPKLFAGISVATLAVVAAASGYRWAELRQGGSAVAELVGARKVDPETTDLAEQRLRHVVEEMAIAASISVPDVYVLPEEAGINAFAAGLTTNDAVIVVTRGALQKLSRDELQGVIGHEFSHILNGDIRLNLKLAAIVFGILVLGLAGRGLLWGLRGSRLTRDDKGGGAIIIFAGLALLVIGYAGYFFGRMILAAVSRQREFLADASSVQFTRNPGGITGALKKIGGYEIGSQLSISHAPGFGHFFFAEGSSFSFAGLWATHPPLAERIRAIDPSFDGTFPEAATIVDVTHETWTEAMHLPQAKSLAPAAKQSAALVAAAGTIGSDSTGQAQALLAAVPPALREAARSAERAPLLVISLLVSADQGVGARQLAAASSALSPEWARSIAEQAAAVCAIPAAQKLALVQLAVPALKALPEEQAATFRSAMDSVARADGSTLAFALRKLVARALDVHRDPSSAYAQIYSFQAVAPEIGVVLSALARASSEDDSQAAMAFAEGKEQLKLLESRLTFQPDPDPGFTRLDEALDKLASASGPIKGRLLMAGAHVVAADGVLRQGEIELLRAVASSLDVPLPTLNLPVQP